MVSGFATGSVLQAKYFPTGRPRRSGQTHVQYGTEAELWAHRWSYCRSIDRLSPIVSLCCIWSKSEGLCGQDEQCGSTGQDVQGDQRCQCMGRGSRSRCGSCRRYTGQQELARIPRDSRFTCRDVASMHLTNRCRPMAIRMVLYMLERVADRYMIIR